MRQFKAATVAELLSELNNARNLQVIGSSNYGDRCGTMQVMPMTGAEIAYVTTTGYSSTGWKVVDEDDVNEETCQKIVLLNSDLCNDVDCALTGEELIELLTELGEEALELPVAHGSDYGDRCSTTQANRASTQECGEARITDSAYSSSGYAILSDEDDWDEDEDEDEKTVYFTVS